MFTLYLIIKMDALDEHKITIKLEEKFVSIS